MKRPFCFAALFLCLAIFPPLAGGDQGDKTMGQPLPNNAVPPANDGVREQARFFAPEGIATDGIYLYIADTNNNTIRKMAISTGVVTTLAGSAASWGSADGLSEEARFSIPRALAAGSGALFVADTNNNTVRKVVIATGGVTTLAGHPGQRGTADGVGGGASFYNPEGIALAGTDLLVADSLNHTIRKVAIATGVVTTLAGAPGNSGAVDGIGRGARFCTPRGLATDGTNLYVADSLNHVIRRVVIATGEVTTLAGSAEGWGATDGKGKEARFYAPHGVALVGNDLFVTDTNNHTIRKVAIATGNVTTLAGSPGNHGSTDGSGANARFFAPHGITGDGTYLYVADTGSDTIRRVTIATGEVTTLAGKPLQVRKRGLTWPADNSSGEGEGDGNAQ